jgi:hypothetical protein
VAQAVDFDCLSYPWHANAVSQECSLWPNTKTNSKSLILDFTPVYNYPSSSGSVAIQSSPDQTTF